MNLFNTRITSATGVYLAENAFLRAPLMRWQSGTLQGMGGKTAIFGVRAEDLHLNPTPCLDRSPARSRVAHLQSSRSAPKRCSSWKPNLASNALLDYPAI